MNLLLDTHVLLWWLEDHPGLSEKARNVIADGANMVFISAVVIWEISIKSALGKLTIPDEFWEIVDRQNFEHLDITSVHARATGHLPIWHRDPFDRMLVAQTKVESLTLVTRDAVLQKYKIPLIMA